jgi:hypothetical protein
MGPVLIVVLNELLQYPLEMPPVEDEQAVKALAPARPDEALRVGVCPRGPYRGANDAHPLGGEDLVEGGGELLVAIMEKEAER